MGELLISLLSALHNMVSHIVYLEKGSVIKSLKEFVANKKVKY